MEASSQAAMQPATAEINADMHSSIHSLLESDPGIKFSVFQSATLNSDNRLGPLTPRPTLERSHGIDNNDEQKGDPEKEAEGSSGLDTSAECVGTAARRPEINGESDRTGEPEDHGDPLQREGDGALERLGEVRREEGNVDENQQSPDGAEEHEGVDAGGSPPG